MYHSIEEVRTHIPALRDKVYFESASTGLIPDFVMEAVSRYQQDRYAGEPNASWLYEDGAVLGTFEMVERSRASIARMLNGEARNVFFSSNFSSAYSLVINSIDFPKGANVVLPEGGWMGGRYAWQVREPDGLELRYAKRGPRGVTADDYIALCDAHTRAVAVNYVESATGQRIDMEKLGAYCRERGILTLVDGSQAIGALHVDVRREHIDFIGGTDYKWMMNFCGSGFGYCSDGLLTQMTNRVAGWYTDDDFFDRDKFRLSPKDGARQFEPGYPNAPGIRGLGLVADQYLAIGGEVIERHILELNDCLAERIRQIPGVYPAYDLKREQHSSIFMLRLAPEFEILQEDFEKENIIVSIWGQPGEERLIRLGLHYYNDRSDIDALCRCLEGAAQHRNAAADERRG